MQTKGKYKVLKRQQVKEDLMLNRSFVETKKKKKQSATVECLQKNKKTTLKDKLHSCEVSSRKQKLSQISEAESTSKEKVFYPYWNKQCAEINSHLWLPTGIGCQGSDMNLLNLSSNKTVGSSWFSTKLYTAPNPNLPKICYPSCMYFPVECTDLENIVVKSKKIRIYPTTEQKQILKKWFGDSRYFFNKTIEYLENNTDYPNFMKLHPVISDLTPSWHKQTPFQIKKMAVSDACDTIKKVRSNRKQGKLSKPNFRTKLGYVQTIYIPKSAVNEYGAYYTKLGKLKSKEIIPQAKYDCRLELFYGDYYIIVPVEEKIVSAKNQARIVSIDSGVRNFASFYSESGCGIIGENAFLPIYKLCLRLDELKSEMSKSKCQRKKRLKKAFIRLSGKIKYLSDELHKKTSKYLLDNYDIILLPTFNVSDMIKKTSKRVINNKTVRRMLSLSHFKFKQFIKFKAKLMGKVVVDVNEAYTTKTVSWTGEVIENIGSKKVIVSPLTKQKMNRDLNAPRGLFIKSLVDMPMLMKFIKIRFVNEC